MHPVIKSFIEGFDKQSRSYKFKKNTLTSGGIRLEVTPEIETSEPTAFHLSFSSPLEIADMMYPFFLFTFVFGNQFDTKALMARQADKIKAGSKYSERFEGWDYSSYLIGARWHIELTKV